MKRIAMLGLLTLTACNDADVASHNLSKAADMFEVSYSQYRVIFKPSAIVPDVDVE